MIFLGHLGITTATIKKCEKSFDKNKKINYSMVLLGSILPDIIDKPIALLIHSTSYKLFAHTFIFSLILLAIGFTYKIITNNINLLILGICSLIHLILDSMWLFPNVFLYPIYGLTFPYKLTIISFYKYHSIIYSIPVLLTFEAIGGYLLIHYFFLKKK